MSKNVKNGFGPQWERMRKIHLKYFPWCVVCDKVKDGMHVHHLDERGKRMRGTYEQLGDIITLCPDHHEGLHQTHTEDNKILATRYPGAKPTGLRDHSMNYIRRERSRLGLSAFRYDRFQQTYHDKFMAAWSEIGRMQDDRYAKKHRYIERSKQARQPTSSGRRTKRRRLPPTKDGCFDCGALHRCKKHRNRTPSHA